MEATFAALRERLAEVTDLGRAGSLLAWDQQTMMPPGGAEQRAEQLATLERLAHERFVADEVGELLERLGPFEAGLPHDSFEASLVRVARRDWEKARRVPGELLAEMARAGSLAQQAWVDARARSDFAALLPHLRRNVELRREYVACFPDVEHPYDALLDDYEPGMRTAEVREVFAALRDALVPLVAEIGERGAPIDDAFLRGPFPVQGQRRVVAEVLGRMGYDAREWRLDDSAHPFQSAIGIRDIRLTTRWDEGSLESLFSTMHEAGHGLYEHGVDAELERTPLASGVSMALHESQSRLWENVVGRSRGFCRFVLPHLAAAFPGRFDGLDAEALHRAVNVVRPSLIRVDADEVTYGLHVILRFELELELVEQRLDLADLPEAWNARMRDYLGVEVPDDARGVLQDIHWPMGAFGYFPTYALGNVIAAQVWEVACAELGDLEERFAAGELGDLRAWLRDRLHRHGRKLTPRETLERVVGGGIDPAPFARYLRAKASDVHGLPAGG